MKKPSRKEHERHLCESVEVACPFCGQVTSVTIDEGAGAQQTFVEDCSVCCRPRVVRFEASDAPRPRAWAERDDGQ